MSKKIGCVILMMIVSMVMLANTALAASFNVTVQPNKKFTDAAINEEIIYTVSTSELTDLLNFEIEYDNTKLEYVTCTYPEYAGVVGERVNFIYNQGSIDTITFTFKKVANSTENIGIELVEYGFKKAGQLDNLPQSEISINYLNAPETQTGNQGTDSGNTNQGTDSGNTNQGTDSGNTNQGTGTTTPDTTGTQTGSNSENSTPTPTPTATPTPTPTNKADNTKATTKLPQTGSSRYFVAVTVFGMAIVVGAGVALKRKF